MNRPIFRNSQAIQPGTEQPWRFAKFSVELLTQTAVRPREAHPRKPILYFATDADGRFPTNLALPVPNTGGWRWRLRWPDGQFADAVIEAGDGSPVEIHDWIILAGLADPEALNPWVTLLADWMAVALSGAAHDVLTVAGGGRLAATHQPRGYWMQRADVADGESVTIPVGHQLIVYGAIEVAGVLQIDGALVVL